MLTTRKMLCLVVFLLAVSWLYAPPVQAQDETPVFIHVNVVQVKPDRVERFRQLHRDVFIPASKKAGTAWRVTRSTVLGDSFEFTVSRPIANFAALDTPNALGMTANEGALAADLWRDSVNSRRSVVIRLRPGLSMEQAPTVDLYRRSRIVVTVGRNAEFEALFADKVLPAIAATGVTGYRMYQTVTGGSQQEYFGVMPIGNYAALDGWSPLQALGEAQAAQVLSELSGLVESIEYSIVQTDRELSWGLAGLD